MTYKDHGMIADIFRRHLEQADGVELPITDEDVHPYNMMTGLLDDVADYCQRDNPRFDRDKFMLTAGIGIV